MKYKKIIVIAPGYGENSTDPCSKDIYNFVHFFIKERQDCKFYIITFDKDNKRRKLIKTFKINTFDWLQNKLLDILSVNKFFGKILYKLLHTKAEKTISRAEREGLRKYFINKKSFFKWMRRHTFLCKKAEYLLSFSNPFYSHMLAGYVKEKNPKITWFPFLYDPHSDLWCNNDTERSVKEENYVFNNCKHIYCTEEVVEKSKNSPIKKYIDKVSYIPTHLLIDKSNCSNNNKSDDEINLYFSGGFIYDVREPIRMLEVFSLLPSNYKLNLNFKGFEDKIKIYKEMLQNRLNASGYIRVREDYENTVARMDVLVIVGNSVNNQIPSKIVEYISYCKPIIYFQSIDNDPALYRYGKYPLLCVISSKDTVSDAANKICDFCIKNKRAKLDYDIVQNMFSSDTVSFLYNDIIKKMGI